MKRSDYFKGQYHSLKDTIVGEIYDIIKHQDDQILDMTDHRKSIVVNSWEDGEVTETIDQLFIHAPDNQLIAISNCMEYNIEGEETNLNNLDVPMLIEILNVVEDLTNN